VIKQNYFVSFALPVVFPLIILLFWEYAGRNGLVSPVIIPAPSRIQQAYSRMLSSGALIRHIKVSFGRVITGYAIGAAAGLTLGIVIGLFRYVERSTILIVNILRPIPMIALVPLLILFFGIGETSKVFLIALGAFWPIFMNTQHGIKSVDVKLLEVAYELQKSQLETLWKVIFPSSLPSIFVGVRLGASTAWMCVVAAEMIASSTGVGYMLMYARETMQTPVMYLGVLIIGLFGLLIDFGLTNLQKFLLRWN